MVVGCKRRVAAKRSYLLLLVACSHCPSHSSNPAINWKVVGKQCLCSKLKRNGIPELSSFLFLLLLLLLIQSRNTMS
ncbi:unnamed protein product [Citrullus colocynthis]|uniref:Secreted protein n=1 Tax=Citrullus colocynthis TaxID=252529 RepID=A0ABP0XW17_9ROSI